MYSFDENGNVLIDASKRNLVEQAKANRTISPRALSLTNMQLQAFNPLTTTTWSTFTRKFRELNSEVWMAMKNPPRTAPDVMPSGSGDLRRIYQKIVQDWISTDLQGFNGALPIIEVQGVSDIIVVMPADGAVIRYLARLVRKSYGLIEVQIGPGNGLRSQVTTINGSSATVNIGEHLMTVRILENFSGALGSRFEHNVNMLRGLRRMMDIRDNLPSISQVFTTLTRKIRSMDGVWGEEGRFWIAGFHRKVPAFHQYQSVIMYDRNFHGNNKELYGDRAVKDLIAASEKLPFINVNESGGSAWTQPTAQ